MKKWQQMVLAQAVVRVGGGRGFVSQCLNWRGRPERIVVTAASCLPKLPPCHLNPYYNDRTYELIGPLGGDLTAWAYCLFADPTFDIAVLGCPDDPRDLPAYVNLTVVTPLSLADTLRILPGGSFRADALVLSPAGDEWIKCTVTHRDSMLSVHQKQLITSEMSGSPILSLTGQAIGVLSRAEASPALPACLPARLEVRTAATTDHN